MSEDFSASESVIEKRNKRINRECVEFRRIYSGVAKQYLDISRVYGTGKDKSRTGSSRQ